MKVRSGLMMLILVFLLAAVPGCVKKLHQAAELGNLKEVKAILEENPGTINEKDSYGMTPLHWAVDKDHRHVVEYLLEKGADVNAEDSNGDTPLRYALNDPEHGRGIAVLLVIKGAKLPGEDQEAREILGGLHPLHEVARLGQAANVKHLLEKYPDQVNARDEFGRTPLYWAARADHSEVVEILLANGGDINAATPDGWTPLHTAIYNRRTKAAELLISRGADVNVKNKDGETPLHWAARRGKQEIIGGLIARGAKIDAVTNDGETPLDWAEDEDIKNLLRRHGAKK